MELGGVASWGWSIMEFEPEQQGIGVCVGNIFSYFFSLGIFSDIS